MSKRASPPSDQRGLQSLRSASGKPRLLALSIALAFSAVVPTAAAAPASAPAVSVQRAAPYWQDVSLAADSAGAKTMQGAQDAKTGKQPALQLKRARTATLDLGGMQTLTAAAPAESRTRAISSPLTISLPHPDGGYQRFTLVESSIMEPGLAARHPGIKTYRGRGIDDPNATLRMDITPLGLHASVRSPNGGYYVDPYYRNDTSVYVSYSRADLINPRAPLVEPALPEAQLSLSRSFYKEGDAVDVRGAGFAPGENVQLSVRGEDEGLVLQNLTARAGETASSAPFQVVDAAASPNALVGDALRTYRLALVTDPTYAAYFGAENVTAAKVTLINRVTQVYEDETAIRLVLIDATDALNLNTPDQMTGANGPCGGAACFTPAQASGCASGTLTRNRVVAGLLAGASNFDVGHIALGLNGGGVASLGVVGGSSKAQGCTGLPQPTGDFFAVDYVAHELGHQFAGNHTFNGINSNCSGGNRSAANSVEPGSGSSIMAYAGICTADNLQNHSDPY